MCPFPRFSTLIAANRQQSQLLRLGDYITWLFKTLLDGAREQAWSATSSWSAKKIARCVRINRWRKSLAIFAGNQIRRDRHIKSLGVSSALQLFRLFLFRNTVNRTLPKASDTLGDFIRRSPRWAKIARCARGSDCDFRRSPRSANIVANIWHVKHRRLNSFPRFSTFIAANLH